MTKKYSPIFIIINFGSLTKRFTVATLKKNNLDLLEQEIVSGSGI